MRKLLLTAVVMLASIAHAVAADMAVKALPPSPFLTTSANGWYIGIGTSASVAASNVSGNVFTLPGITGGNLNAAGGTLDVDAGYIWGSCFFNTWCQAEADTKYQNISGANDVGSVSSRWAFTQELDVGIDVVQMLASYWPGFTNPFPTFSPSGLLPANIAVAANPRGYVGFKQVELLVDGNVGGAGGQTWQYAPGVTGGWRWQTLGANGKPNGASIKAFADILWADKGVSITNLFGTGGAPMVLAPKAGMNTIYEAGFHVDFGL